MSYVATGWRELESPDRRADTSSSLAGAAGAVGWAESMRCIKLSRRAETSRFRIAISCQLRTSVGAVASGSAIGRARRTGAVERLSRATAAASLETEALVSRTGSEVESEVLR